MDGIDGVERCGMSFYVYMMKRIRCAFILPATVGELTHSIESIPIATEHSMALLPSPLCFVAESSTSKSLSPPPGQSISLFSLFLMHKDWQHNGIGIFV